MEVFRYSRDIYGQEALEGISFDLIWIFVGVSSAIIIGHMAYKFIMAKKG